MTLKELYKAAAEGKKLRCKSWKSIRYIVLMDDRFVDDEGEECGDEMFMEPANLWEIYEEQKDLDFKIKEAEHDLEDFLDKGMALSATCKKG